MEFDDSVVPEREWPDLQEFLDEYSPGLGMEFRQMQQQNMLPQLPQFVSMIRDDMRRVRAGGRARWIPTIQENPDV